MANLISQIFGRMYDADDSYFPNAITTATFVDAPRIAQFAVQDRPVITIAVDPPSSQVSSMGICATIMSKSGTTLLIGAAEIKAERCNVVQIEMICSTFTQKVLQLSLFHRISRDHLRILPIVECNNCAILSGSIVETIVTTASVVGVASIMPFQRSFFKTGISDNIGIITTDNSKLADILHLFKEMAKSRVRVYTKMVTLGPIYAQNPITPTIDETMIALRDSLVQFKDVDKKITGKTSSTNDDLAMALLIGMERSHSLEMRRARGEYEILNTPYRSK